MAMHRSKVWLWCGLVALASAGCAARIEPPQAPGAATEPRASWLIRTGNGGVATHEVCRSDSPQPCVIDASRTKPESVSVSVYLYDAGAKTTYSGAFLSGFMEGAKPVGHETTVDYAVEANTKPSAVAAIGGLKTTPGDYELRIFLFAQVEGSNDPHQYVRSVAVRVI
jgi:hypothetical protein